MIIAPLAARPQPRRTSSAFLASLPAPAASRRAWGRLLASRLRHEAELAAADTERAIDALLVRQILAARQRLIDARIPAERKMASNAIRLLSAARLPRSQWGLA